MRLVLLWLLLPVSLLSSAARADEAAIREKLRSRVQVKFEETPLREVLKNLGEQAGVNFWIAEKEIQVDGEGTVDDLTVTLDFGEIQLDSALYFILERSHQLAAIPGKHDVTITSTTARSSRFLTKVYPIGVILDGMQSQWQPRRIGAADIRSLLSRLPQWEWRNNHTYVREYGYSSLGLGIGLFQFSSGKSSLEVIPQIHMTVGESIDPSWLELSYPTRTELTVRILRQISIMTDDCFEACVGVNGNISLADDALVIHSTANVHDQVETILHAIELMFTEDQSPIFQWAIRPNYPVKEDEAVQKSLRQVGSLEVVDQSLDVVLHGFAKQAGIRLWIDEARINADGGTVNDRITYSSRNLPYETILARLMEESDLCYEIHEGVVIINSDYSREEDRYPAVYDTSYIPEANHRWKSGDRLIPLIEQSVSGEWGVDDRRSGSAVMLTPTILVINQSKKVHGEIVELLQGMRKRKWNGSPPPEAAKQPDLRPEFLTRVYPVFDPEAIEPSMKILKKILAGDNLKWIEVVKDTIVIQCSDEGHIRAEAYFEAIESAHKRRIRQIKSAPATEPTPTETP